MRRRDFLATLAAAVGCAAVPVKAAMKPNGGWWIHCQDATWANPVWHLMQYDGEKWVDMGPADLKTQDDSPSCISQRKLHSWPRAAQPRRSAWHARESVA